MAMAESNTQEPGEFRVWSPEELARGALREDPPTTEGWEDDPEQDGEVAQANEAGEDTSGEEPTE